MIKINNPMFQIGDRVRVSKRLEEAGHPPFFEATIYEIKAGIKGQKTLYSAVEDDCSKIDGYTDEWLSQSPTPERAEFSLDEEQYLKFLKWRLEHHCKYDENQGAIGGRFTFSFTPTSIGQIETVHCACGEKINVTDYSNF